MPSGPAHLHERYVDDSVAWTYLRRRGFTQTRFVVAPPYRGYKLTKGESDAIDYLWMEWDWAYAPTEAPERPVERSRLSQALRWVSRVSSGPLRVTDAYLTRRRHRRWQREYEKEYHPEPGDI